MKINEQYTFLNSEKKLFLALFASFFQFLEQKNVFSKNSGSATHNVWHHAKLYRNLMIKKTTRQQDRRMDRPYFIEYFQTLLINTTAADWYLNIKNIECNVCLFKTYCINVSMQNIRSIHTLILKIQHILGSRELNKWPSPFFITPT